MRRATILAFLAFAAAPAGARAQALVHFYVPDTALTILTNRTATAELRVSGVSGISAYDITIFLDDSRVQLVAADTLPGYGLNPPSIIPGTEQVTLQGSGPGFTYFTTILARLTFHLDTLATLGSLLSIRVNSLTDGLGANVLSGHRTGLLQVCQAEQMGGDVSGERVVNSRDALAVLTASVGLPAPGFDVGRPGDVDADGQTTSRDALFILSYGIGLSTFGAPLLGVGLINQCPPLAAAPNDIVFWRSTQLYKIAGSDTVPTSLGLSGIADYYARWSPNGSKLLFTASLSGLGYEVMLVNADGTGLDTLSQNSANDFAADWAPDSSQIAFVSSRVSPQSIWAMNPDGSGQRQVTTTHYVYDLAWSPDGARLAFTGYDPNACCARRLWVVDPNGSNVVEVFGGSGVHAPQDPVWSPNGDSLIYYSYPHGRVYTVAANGDTTLASTLAGSQDSPWWANAAHTFRSLVGSAHHFFLRRFSDGRHLRLTRGAGTGDQRASVRRTLSGPAKYVETVSVTPDSIQLDPDSVDTLQVVVLDQLGAPIAAPVSWRSRDTTVAKVDGPGIVTASRNPGVTYVVATAGWRSDSAQVVVAVMLRSVSSGGFHACGISSDVDSLVYCWGYNGTGQIGNGTTVNSSHPMRVAGGLKFASITTGNDHTCGIASGGAVFCWGYNAYGQVGDGTTSHRTEPTAVSGGLAFIWLDAGGNFTCGIATGNAAHCWGDNPYGQLGDSTTVDKLVPTPVKAGLVQFVSISAGGDHACAISTAALAYCWGRNASGRLGDNTATDRPVPTAVSNAQLWDAVGAFGQHSCGVETSSQAAYCWGYNGYGQLGDSTFTDRSVPTGVKGSLSFTSLTGGGLHSCGVTTLSAAYCWGYNGYGQLGDGSTTGRFAPVAVSGGLVMGTMSGGLDFTCGATIDPDVVYCWGRNSFGELADGTLTGRLAPVRVVGQK